MFFLVGGFTAAFFFKKRQRMPLFTHNISALTDILPDAIRAAAFLISSSPTPFDSLSLSSSTFI